MLGRPGFQSWLYQASSLSKLSFSHSSNRLNQSLWAPEKLCVWLAGLHFPWLQCSFPFTPHLLRFQLRNSLQQKDWSNLETYFSWGVALKRQDLHYNCAFPPSHILSISFLHSLSQVRKRLRSTEESTWVIQPNESRLGFKLCLIWVEWPWVNHLSASDRKFLPYKIFS